MGGRTIILLVSLPVIMLFSVKIINKERENRWLSLYLYQALPNCLHGASRWMWHCEDSHFWRDFLSQLRKTTTHVHTHTSLKLQRESSTLSTPSQPSVALPCEASQWDGSPPLLTPLTGVLAAGPSLLSAPAGCPPLQRPLPGFRDSSYRAEEGKDNRGRIASGVGGGT